MANFNELWGADNPSDSTNANEIDDYENNLRNMLAERLQDMIYGFTSGEDTDAPGFKKATFKQQSGAPSTPNADEVVFYALDDGSNCGLYAKNEDGYATQILKKIGSTFTIPAGAYGADSIDEDDIRLANNANLTGRNNAGDGDVNIIKVNTSDGITLGAVTTLPDTSALATSGAPAADAQIANKKYVDDQDTAITDPTYEGGESHTFIGGLIIKSGYVARSGSTTTVTFGTAFPNTVVSCAVTVKHTGDATYNPIVTNLTTSALTIYNSQAITGYYWIAIGY